MALRSKKYYYYLIEQLLAPVSDIYFFQDGSEYRFQDFTQYNFN